jgi:geranylgeranyl pyrophosphate synthase
MELELSDRAVSEGAYFVMAEAKTAALFIAATSLGAIMGNRTVRDREALAKYFTETRHSISDLR